MSHPKFNSSNNLIIGLPVLLCGRNMVLRHGRNPFRSPNVKLYTPVGEWSQKLAQAMRSKSFVYKYGMNEPRTLFREKQIKPRFMEWSNLANFGKTYCLQVCLSWCYWDLYCTPNQSLRLQQKQIHESSQCFVVSMKSQFNHIYVSSTEQ